MGAGAALATCTGLDVGASADKGAGVGADMGVDVRVIAELCASDNDFASVNAGGIEPDRWCRGIGIAVASIR